MFVAKISDFNREYSYLALLLPICGVMESDCWYDL